ncbi:PEP-CTERM sorting domain-containing protein [uncultured Thiodictyon sp.]|jgi:hypothetical protein|uniref:PEP-CTERM sorting domain-containing protein n=1 Tax=uncultured Thiodictyon sp. TaxID=1846217 RepID=UPI0025D0D051|nr:PEP-CTERM sorting domain-containing protein [uncultured Thiodictyon sp.]
MPQQSHARPRHLSGAFSTLCSAVPRAALRRLWPLCLAGASLALLPLPGNAAIIAAYNDPNLFGTLNQKDVVLIGDSACAPTSVVNSFVYLEQRYPAIFGRSLVPEITVDDQYDTAELRAVALTLAGPNYMATTEQSGTQDGYMAYGKEKYMEEKIPDKTLYRAVAEGAWDGPSGMQPDWYQARTVPTIEFLYEALSGAFDVEVGVTWTTPGETGGHWITAYGLLFDTLTEKGTLDFIDPWLAVRITGDLILSGGKLQLTYTGGAAEDETLTSTIDIIVAETPEPAVVFLFGAGGLTLLFIRRRRKV